MNEFWASVISGTIAISIVSLTIALGCALIFIKGKPTIETVRVGIGAVLVIVALSFCFSCYGWAVSGPH